MIIKRTLVILLFTCLFLLTLSPCQFAQEPVPQPSVPPPSPPPPPISGDTLGWQNFKPMPVEKVSAGVFRLGEITIYKNTRSITFPAVVNMKKGLLEYLLVYAAGKTHESLFRTNVQPFNLQIAFLLLGFEGTDKPNAFQGDPEKPRGEHIEITVTYNRADGKSVTIQPEEWIVKVSENKPQNAGNLEWVFTGSVIMDGRFLAQTGGSIAAIFHDPAAIIDNASQGGESDEIWFVKEDSVPAVGTQVMVNINAIAKK